MKLVQVSTIATGSVILIGLVMLVPTFMHVGPSHPVLLAISINDNVNMPNWCSDLASILEKQKIKAAVFITGKVAEQYPDCVSSFPKDVDIGSQTYDYVALPTIFDYSSQLDEVKEGKAAVDQAGNIDSKLFKAPYGSTDQNIYSLLSRSGILADFSYPTQFNKYYDNQFIKFDIVSYSGASHSASFFRNVSTPNPIMINLDNSVSINSIDNLISGLKSNNFRFVSASDLTFSDLTTHEESNK